MWSLNFARLSCSFPMASKLVAEMAPEDLLNRWRDHIATCADDWIYELQNRTRYRAVDRLLARTLHRGGRTDQTRGWLETLWVTDAVMAVRRAMDDQSGVINIRHLLFELEQRPEVATREEFMTWARISANVGVCWCGADEQEALATSRFESFPLIRYPRLHQWDGGERDHIAPEAVRADRQVLEAETRLVFNYAQRLVAHRTPMKHHHMDRQPVVAAIDSVWRTIQRYYLYISGEPLTPKTPRPPRNWHKSLRGLLTEKASR